MGHTVQAFIAKAEILQNAVGALDSARVIALGQGLALLLNTDEFYDEVHEGSGGNELPYAEFYKLSPELAKLGAETSTRGLVAYVETEYSGGHGGQAALLWEGGRVVYGPDKAAVGPINEVLRRMGVVRGNSLDEFEAVGLHRYRDNEDWVEQSRYDTSA